MFSFIRNNPLIAGVIALVLIAAVVGLFKYWDAGDQRQENQLVNSGELIERGRANEKVLNNVRTANDARDNPTPDQLNSVCDKYDRNCKNGQ